MSIDLSKLSAKELYELARQKEQEEQQQAALNEELNQLKAQHEELLTGHQQTLGRVDGEISQLQAQRERLINEHDTELAKLNGKIKTTRQQLVQQQTAPKPVSTAPAAAAKIETAKPVNPEPATGKKPETTPPTASAKNAAATASPSAAAAAASAASDIDELFKIIIELMRSREYISDTLLKEKLKGMGHTSANLSKQLEQLVKDKKLIRKSGGSYVLGKK